MKRIIVTLMLFVVCLKGLGQRKYAADRYFKEYAYTKSAELYQELYDKGEKSYTVLSRLADSYYFISSFQIAEKYYRELMSNYEKIAFARHVFRYSHVLKSNGNPSVSDRWLIKLKKIKEDDTRVLALESNEDYFSEYMNKPKTYINIHNLSINTEYSDFGGFSHNGKLYFASSGVNSKNSKIYEWNNQPYLNVYKSEEFLLEAGAIDVGIPKELNSLNTKFHESNAVVSKNGKTIYFTRGTITKDRTKKAILKIYKAKKQYNGVWGDIKELPFNSENYSVGHPALSPDERELYFVSDMPGGYGETDLYKVSILDNSNYGKPHNLGNLINTEGREMFPFIGSDKQLYFASDGHLGLGALDVFESSLEDSKYGPPVNLGAPINGPMDDFSFIIDESGKRGYFSSNRSEGKGDDDIYSFRVYKCKESVEGIVKDARSSEPILDVVVELFNENGQLVVKDKTNSRGMYRFENVSCENNFVIKFTKDNYKLSKRIITTLDIDKEKLIQNIDMERLIVNDQIVINPIYFDFDLDVIRKDSEFELEHIVAVMKTYPEMKIRIESHTDSRGEASYNKKLSQRRADATSEYIISRGISKDRIISAVGYGESQLLNHCKNGRKSNCSEEEHKVNRRSYFYVVKKN
ncbi:OmpA family protein [Tenacibaculum xiamenense]|uniref:OmpA family protein n=1 Tax=Tenacibaculum xiamenense TaxID=1261553 RepID=UPI0038938A7E